MLVTYKGRGYQEYRDTRGVGTREEYLGHESYHGARGTSHARPDIAVLGRQKTNVIRN